jgi:hypothetical protein
MVDTLLFLTDRLPLRLWDALQIVSLNATFILVHRIGDNNNNDNDVIFLSLLFNGAVSIETIHRRRQND